MSAEEIRKEFEEFVGNEKYKHFILTLYEAFPLRNRLFFWQEQLIEDFSNEFNIEPIEFGNVYQIFNQCPVHYFELKNDNVPIVDGNEVISKISYKKEKELFPMANINAPRDLQRFNYPKSVDVVYCEKCRSVSKKRCQNKNTISQRANEIYMKAIVYDRYGPPEVLQLKTVEKPVPKANEILLKIHATAVTMGDCEMRSPKIPNFIWFIVRLFFGLRKPRKKILGSYLAGEVEAAGEAATSFKKGDQLFGISTRFGAYAQYLCLPEKAVLTTLPSNMSYGEAAPVGLGLDSLHFLKKAGIEAGQKVLINGAGGGIGTYAVQLAKYYGAEVTAVDSADKLEMLRAVGADKVIDYTAGDFTKNGERYDIVFDVVGALSHRRGLRLLTKKGRYISAIPLVSRLIPDLWVSLTTKKKMMTGLTSPTGEALGFLKELIEAGQLKTVIDKSYSLEETADAHRYIEQDLKKGNVVLLLKH